MHFYGCNTRTIFRWPRTFETTLLTFVATLMLFLIYLFIDSIPISQPPSKHPHKIYSPYMYVQLPGHTLPTTSTGYHHGLFTEIDGSTCEHFCSSDTNCIMYVFHKRRLTCKLYDNDAYQLGLRPMLDMEATIYLKMMGHSAAHVSSQGDVFWRDLQPMGFLDALVYCTSHFERVKLNSMNSSYKPTNYNSPNPSLPVLLFNPEDESGMDETLRRYRSEIMNLKNNSVLAEEQKLSLDELFIGIVNHIYDTLEEFSSDSSCSGNTVGSLTALIPTDDENIRKPTYHLAVHDRAYKVGSLAMAFLNILEDEDLNDGQEARMGLFLQAIPSDIFLRESELMDEIYFDRLVNVDQVGRMRWVDARYAKDKHVRKISPTSVKQGYPMCQGSPFNLLSNEWDVNEAFDVVKLRWDISQECQVEKNPV